MTTTTLESEVSVFRPGDKVRPGTLDGRVQRNRLREGTVVGPSRLRGKIRVLWNGLKRPQVVDAAHLQLVDHNEAETVASTEVLIAAIDEELERSREARFAPHLKVPRERPVQLLPMRRQRGPHVARIIGLGTAGIAIGSAYMLMAWF